MRGRSRRLLCAMLLLVGCEPADEVEVQPLPPLNRPSAEVRAGLPEVAGVWRFAGWELPAGDSAGLEAELPALGQIALQTQRLDSIAGFYAAGQSRVPLVGEVRRDSLVALAAMLGEGEGRFLAGRVSADTLWLSLTSLLEPGSWRAGSRAAFVRSQVAGPFVRIHGAPVLAAAPDSLASDTAGLPALAGAAMDSVAAPSPVQARPPAATADAPARTQPTAPPARARAEEQQPARAEPQRTEQAPPVTRPDPVPETTPPPRRPRLLGEPVRQDTVGDTIAYSPSAARASARPRSVSASR